MNDKIKRDKSINICKLKKKKRKLKKSVMVSVFQIP